MKTFHLPGQWLDSDIVLLQRQADFARLPLNPSVAYTTNGQLGDLYRCSSQVHSIMNFSSPLPTTDDCGWYRCSIYQALQNHSPHDRTCTRLRICCTTTAILEYRSTRRSNQSRSRPVLPAFNDTATAYTARIRGLTRVKVFTKVYVNLYFTLGLGLINCTNPNSPLCQAPNGTHFTASMNNVSFELPRTTSLMQAYYERIPSVFTKDFAPVPPVQFDYTGNVPRGLWTPSRGTKLYKVKYGSRMQIVLQNTSIVTTEEHPMHVHGFHFFVIGSGFGNFNPATDPLKFNLVDPPVKNTIGTPPGGWVAIRFVADNPGIWFIRCHIDSHLNSGLGMALLVEHGVGLSRPFTVINTSTARSTPMLRLRKHQ
ncbi:hypothetical protein LR48_Vigan503s001200 [Vigna angularis]|uniref:Plastocyanin-like domain-containing protein n=1 Tax=Phaseolus angularis TaxID=3914 RepID=A0A0L9TC88_PHAAN|nr:hypothetical protein LR48_Vigan503s001200 [Vigna angularis]